METLKEKTAKGLLWGMLNNGTTQVLNLVFGIFLARLITPSEYGIIGVLTIFTTIAGNIQSAGFTQALINLKRPTDNDYNAVFWFNVITSLVMYSVLFFCAPLIALYFRQPCLVEVSRVVFTTFVISSLGIVHNAFLIKNLMIRETTIAGFVALVLSGTVGVTMAVLGMSYWSLAWQQIVYISVMNIMRLRYSRWRPSLHVDFSPIKRMFGFSVKILITNIINTIGQNVLTPIFGRMLPISQVGHYTQANKWNTMAYTMLGGTIAMVAQPVLNEISDEREREKNVYRKMLRFTVFLSFPALWGLALVSNEFILLTIKEQWAGCVPLLRILCVGGAFMPIYTLNQNLVISKGRSDIYLWCNVTQIVLQIAIVLVFAGHGIRVMLAIYTLFNILYLGVWHYFVHKVIGLRITEVLCDIIPFLFASAFVMSVTYYITLPITNMWILLFCRIIVASLLYFTVMKVARVKILDECLRFAADKLRKRNH